MATNPGDFGTATSTAAAATIHHSTGVITTESLTTAANGVYNLTLTNNNIGANSVVLADAWSGTNTTQGLVVNEVTPAAGSCVITVKNSGGAALNGTIKIGFLVVP